jgi:hypothetical protein
VGGPIYLEDLIPHLMALTTDKSNKVKELLIKSAADWIASTSSNGQDEFQFMLLIILLTGVFDQFPSVQALTLQSLEKLGQLYEKIHTMEISDELQHTTTSNDMSYLPPFFNGLQITYSLC